MPGPTIVVIADDLTGAAEVAAIGRNSGWRAFVATQPGPIPDRAFPRTGETLFDPGRKKTTPNLFEAPGAATALASPVPTPPTPRPGAARLFVYDSNTRLVKPRRAATIAASFAHGAKWARANLVFKKTDSVLRGNILAECEAIAGVTGARQVLLVPANPGRGRVVRDGHYYIAGRPIHHTEFRRDPHHPAISSKILSFFPRGAAVVRHLQSGKPQRGAPSAPFVLGEGWLPEHLTGWAQRLDRKILPAGAAEFFSAILAEKFPQQYIEASSTKLPTAWLTRGSTLIIIGSRSTANASFLKTARAARSLINLPRELARAGNHSNAVFSSWRTRIAEALASRPNGSVAVATIRPGDASAIQKTLERLVKFLWQRRAFRHLVVTGGATAGGIFSRIGCSHFEVLGQWTPGVALMRPAGNDMPFVTVKPGSYSWPANLAALWNPRRKPRSRRSRDTLGAIAS